MTALVVLEGLVIVVLAVLVVGLLRSHAEILRALHELGASVYADDEAVGSVDSPVPFRTRPGIPDPRPAAGDQVHDVMGSLPEGGASRVAVVGTGGLTLLAFLSSGCSTCRNFWTAFADPEQRQPVGLEQVRIVVVTKGPEAESEASVAALAPPGVATLMSSAAWVDYEVPVAPYFILVDGTSDSVVGEGAAGSWDQVQSLLAQAMADGGVTVAGGRSSVDRRRAADREAEADQALLDAGIGPGHTSLYPDAVSDS